LEENESMQDKIRVLISKIGLDGHDRGAKVVASLLREGGMEVVYLGMYQTPENIIRAAIQEDVDVVGVSTLSGEHLTLVPKLVELMRQEKLDDMLLVVGGVIPVEDVPMLKGIGVDEVFPAGTLTATIVEGITRGLEGKHRAKQPQPV
jgi:methylmalonyl-CoA mutase C-terminal domain/subunit